MSRVMKTRRERRSSEGQRSSQAGGSVAELVAAEAPKKLAKKQKPAQAK